jgi:hypothetical protein
MKFRTIFFFALLVSTLAIAPGACFAQSQTPSATDQPATVSAPAPTQTAPAAPAPAAPIPNAKPAKVWTNDEIDVLHNDHSVSVVGNSKPQKVSAKATAKGYTQEKDPAWYKNQLEPLRADIVKLDPQIAKLKAFLSGENVSDPTTGHEHRNPTPQDQLKQLEAKRESDETKISDLLDRARHNGIEPGQLR